MNYVRFQSKSTEIISHCILQTSPSAENKARKTVHFSACPSWPQRTRHTQTSLPWRTQATTTGVFPREMTVNFPSELLLSHALMCRLMRGAGTVCWYPRRPAVNASCWLGVTRGPWPSDMEPVRGQREGGLCCGCCGC